MDAGIGVKKHERDHWIVSKIFAINSEKGYRRGDAAIR